MSDEPMVKMLPVKCDAECGRTVGWNDTGEVTEVILCTHCVGHPDELVQRLGLE